MEQLVDIGEPCHYACLEAERLQFRLGHLAFPHCGTSPHVSTDIATPQEMAIQFYLQPEQVGSYPKYPRNASTSVAGKSGGVFLSQRCEQHFVTTEDNRSERHHAFTRQA